MPRYPDDPLRRSLRSNIALYYSNKTKHGRLMEEFQDTRGEDAKRMLILDATKDTVAGANLTNANHVIFLGRQCRRVQLESSTARKGKGNVRKSWNPDVEGTCLPDGPTFYGLAAVTIVFDVIIIPLPIPALLKLQISEAEKKEILWSGLAAVTIFFLVIIIPLPIPALLKLQIRKAKKVVLAISFSTGHHDWIREEILWSKD
ncbi:MAG: hypothetical protein LQ346_008314 [Caloplaca aetnensis]|nr:MAG: hypothetical protein LQ346_008314 [Caloplaca aetnensis]